MLYSKFQTASTASGLEQPALVEKVICVGLLCAMCSLPLLMSVALTLWGA
jgi:hypothetical protein